MSTTYGPQTEVGNAVHTEKYRQKNESFRAAMTRVASTLSDSDLHFQKFRDLLLDMRFLPGGRIQAAMGSSKVTTPYNCFVSGTIEDTYTNGPSSIMARATDAANTMRLGGGIGYDFSTLRPRGELIKTLESHSSGPVSFMPIYDAVGLATASSGHRRGAQMAVLRCDHPDIEEFVRSKQNATSLTGFNISVAITSEFMTALKHEDPFPLRFGRKVYKMISAVDLWNEIMRSTYDWSEPGVLFIDTINEMNNLYYCEQISATNPCGEQPLPPFGACLLGSFNLVRYLKRDSRDRRWEFDYNLLFSDIPAVVRAMDNVVDRARYPLHEQQKEAESKRRMGLGVTGLANAIEALGHLYGEAKFLTTMDEMLRSIKNSCYYASALLAKEKEPFPLFDKAKYLDGNFINSLDDRARDAIAEFGIRNSHLLSIAPTGTISLAADNVSSGIEPVFSYEQQRAINYPSGAQVVNISDYGVERLGVRGKTSQDCTVEDHLAILTIASRHVDSAVSKTCNVPNNYPWDDFKSLYVKAHENGCKGITTHRSGNLRGSILVSRDEENPLLEGVSCEIDPESGRRSCE